MTPKEKAKELYNKLVVHIQRYDGYVDDRSKFKTIQCALIAVDEIIDRLIWHTGASDLGNTLLIDDIKYYEEVKKEIEKL
jgi:hypothetical protein